MTVHRISKLLYVEEFANTECRYVKFWYAADLVGGSIDTSHPEPTDRECFALPPLRE